VAVSVAIVNLTSVAGLGLVPGAPTVDGGQVA
jgi:hypothetical protein